MLLGCGEQRFLMWFVLGGVFFDRGESEEVWVEMWGEGFGGVGVLLWWEYGGVFERLYDWAEFYM